MDIDILLKKIIPPETRDERESFFNNKSIIDSLNSDIKKIVEKKLIERILKDNYDPLILDTLIYLKSEEAILILNDKLINIEIPQLKIKIASSIYLLNTKTQNFNELEEIAIDSFNLLKDRYQIGLSFYDLVKFKSRKMIDIIRSNQNSKDYHISYHAKKALEIE